jgi:hypothetical protein
MSPRRALVFTLAAAAFLAVAATALAKGVVGGQACGANGCKAISQQAAEALLAGGESSHPPPRAGVARITIRLELGAHGSSAPALEPIVYDYAPSLGITRPHDELGVDWVALNRRARTLVDAAIADVQPLAAGRRAAIHAIHPQDDDDGSPWWLVPAAGLAGLALLGLLARYATSALNARPRSS